jgi:hypothetical protein
MTTTQRKRFWFDPRLAIGLVLIVASVAGVFGIVSTADASTQVLAARDDLAPGDRIDEDDLIETSARLADTDLYLLPGDLPDAGLVVTTAVGEGELVPLSAVGDTAGTRLASVVVTINGQLPGAVGPGTTVDLWAARKDESTSFGPPSVIVSGATVVRIIESEGLVASGDVTTIELLVPRLKVARVLEAVANVDALSVVPTSLPLSK